MLQVEKNKLLVTNAFNQLYNQQRYDKETMHQYFSKDFFLYVNGKIKKLDTLIDQLAQQFQKFESMHIKFLEILADKDKVSSIHILEVISKNKEKQLWQGCALFYIEQSKIVRAFENVGVIENPDNDPLLSYFSG
jgi:hypothetical protein